MSDREAILKIGDILETSIETAGQVLVELIKASAVSPTIASVTSILIAEIFQKKFKLIQADAASLIKGIATAAIGVDLTGKILTAALPWSHSQSGITHYTVVEGDKGGRRIDVTGKQMKLPTSFAVNASETEK